MKLYTVYMIDPMDADDKNGWTYVDCTTKLCKIPEIKKKFSDIANVEYDESDYIVIGIDLPVDEFKEFFNQK